MVPDARFRSGLFRNSRLIDRGGAPAMLRDDQGVDARWRGPDETLGMHGAVPGRDVCHRRLGRRGVADADPGPVAGDADGRSSQGIAGRTSGDLGADAHQLGQQCLRDGPVDGRRRRTQSPSPDLRTQVQLRCGLVAGRTVDCVPVGSAGSLAEHAGRTASGLPAGGGRG